MSTCYFPNSLNVPTDALNKNTTNIQYPINGVHHPRENHHHNHHHQPSGDHGGDGGVGVVV